MHLRTAVKCELAAEVARAFGEVRVEATGSSMLPAVRPGDRLVVRRRDFSEVQAGQIVVYYRGGGLVAHRVVGRSGSAGSTDSAGDQLLTRGDSLQQDDSPVQASEMVGEVVRIERGGRQVSPEQTMRRRVGAWVLGHWGFATRVMLHFGRAGRIERTVWAR